MINRKNFVLTTVEEDFKKIGIIPENSLTESSQLHEMDDPRNPRDIPSPDPSTLGGQMDQSGNSINTKARHSTGQFQSGGHGCV